MKLNINEALAFFDFPIEQFHDRSIRWLLEDKENVKGLFEILSTHLVEQIDFSQLTLINKTYIPDNLRKQESDMIYSVPFRGESENEKLLIYILIEHQSTVDISMGYRVLFYMTQIWDAQRRDWESNNLPKNQWRLQPIVPIVLYTGDRKWKHPLSLHAMMDVPESLKGFVPSYDILFLNVKDTDRSDLTRTDHPFGWLLTVLQKEQGSINELMSAILEAVRHIDTLDADDVQQWQRAVFYIYLLIMHRRPPTDHEVLKSLVRENIQNTVHQEEEELMERTMAEHLIKQGIEKGIEKGEKRGQIQAKRETLLKMLDLRIGSVPVSVANKVSRMRSLTRLDSLLEQVATANVLDDIDWK